MLSLGIVVRGGEARAVGAGAGAGAWAGACAKIANCASGVPTVPSVPIVPNVPFLRTVPLVMAQWMHAPTLAVPRAAIECMLHQPLKACAIEGCVQFVSKHVQ